MKLRNLAAWSLCAMTLSCTTVYMITPPKPPLAGKADATAEPAAEISRPQTLQTPGLSIDARAGHATLGRDGTRKTHILVELRGRDDVEQASFRSDTALVIDRSGSMAGARMARALDAARGWVGRTTGDDTLSVVVFNDSAMSLGRQSSLMHALDRVVPSGGTCISCGVESALDLMGNQGGMVRRVILLSDGEANEGVTSVAGFRELAQRCRRSGISVSTVGVGVGYNERVLTALAFNANGNHFFVQHESDLPRVFATEAATLAKTAAVGVEAELQLGDGVELVRVLDRSAERRDNKVVVPLGTLAAGEVKTVIAEVMVEGDVEEVASLADVTVRQAGGQAHTRLAIAIGDSDSAVDPFVSTRLARSDTADTLEQADALFRDGRKTEALEALRRHEEALRKHPTRSVANRSSDPRTAALSRDFDAQAERLNKARRHMKRARPKSKPAKAARKHMAVDRLMMRH